MSEQIRVTATVAAWMNRHDDPTRFMEEVENGDGVSAVQRLTFYGTPDREKFGDWFRVGVADVTVTLIPRDEQVRQAVELLQQQLNEARAEWLTKQQEILDQINKLQALEYVEAA